MIKETRRKLNEAMKRGHPAKLKLQMFVKIPGFAERTLEESWIVECRTPAALEYFLKEYHRVMRELNAVTVLDAEECARVESAPAIASPAASAA